MEDNFLTNFKGVGNTEISNVHFINRQITMNNVINIMFHSCFLSRLQTDRTSGDSF